LLLPTVHIRFVGSALLLADRFANLIEWPPMHRTPHTCDDTIQYLSCGWVPDDARGVYFFRGTDCVVSTRSDIMDSIRLFSSIPFRIFRLNVFVSSLFALNLADTDTRSSAGWLASIGGAIINLLRCRSVGLVRFASSSILILCLFASLARRVGGCRKRPSNLVHVGCRRTSTESCQSCHPFFGFHDDFLR
jgi:hypothetical protein